MRTFFFLFGLLSRSSPPPRPPLFFLILLHVPPGSGFQLLHLPELIVLFWNKLVKKITMSSSSVKLEVPSSTCTNTLNPSAKLSTPAQTPEHWSISDQLCVSEF
jgi:hypothetical protein